MKKGVFCVSKARKNLLKLDYIQSTISLVALVNSFIAAQFIVIPKVVVILYVICLLSLLLLIKGIKNIKSYYKKSDELYNYMSII